MRSTILNVTFDCANPGSVARFWSAVTGWTLHEEDLQPGHQEYSVGPPAEDGIRLYFVGVPEPKTIKNRIHLDLIPPGDQQQEIARLVELGASVADSQPDGVGWIVLADPEGNEFCLEAAGD
jgi:predicted enzyme related to lactoylglutathione lyase